MWINTETLAVYKSIHGVRSAAKNFSFAGSPALWPAQIAGYSWEYGDPPQTGRYEKVREVARPVVNDRTHFVTELSPVFDGTEWVQTWQVTARTAQEEAERRQLIKDGKAAEIDANLEAALRRAVEQWSRTQFPGLVATANARKAQLNASQTPEDIDTTIE